MSRLQPFGERIWTGEGPRVRMWTIPFSTRMTVVEVQPGRLWVHSPLPQVEDWVEALAALGEVA